MKVELVNFPTLHVGQSGNLTYVGLEENGTTTVNLHWKMDGLPHHPPPMYPWDYMSGTFISVSSTSTTWVKLTYDVDKADLMHPWYVKHPTYKEDLAHPTYVKTEVRKEGEDGKMRKKEYSIDFHPGLAMPTIKISRWGLM